MFNVMYGNTILTDNKGFPRDFESREEIESYLSRYNDLDRDFIEVIDIGEFVFSLPKNVLNKCPEGYLEKVQQLAMITKRYRQLQMQLTNLGEWGAYRNSDEIVVDLYDDISAYSFYWVAHYKYSKDRLMNGGIIFHKPAEFFKEDGSIDETKLPLGEYEGWSTHS